MKKNGWLLRPDVFSFLNSFIDFQEFQSLIITISKPDVLLIYTKFHGLMEVIPFAQVSWKNTSTKKKWPSLLK